MHTRSRLMKAVTAVGVTRELTLLLLLLLLSLILETCHFVISLAVLGLQEKTTRDGKCVSFLVLSLRDR